MTVTLKSEIVEDALEISMARALAAANKRASKLGVNLIQIIITITHCSVNGGVFWRVNYGPKDYIGRRGGDLIIEVNPENARINRVIWGQ